MKGAIFDIDGTILDSMFIWEEVGEKFLNKMGIEPEEDLGDILFVMTFDEAAKYIREKYTPHLSDWEIIGGVMSVAESFYRNEVLFKPGVKAFLDALKEKGISMILATAGFRDFSTAALTRLGVMDYFDCMLVADELETTKHEPKIYFEAAKKIGLAVEDCVVFEDVLHAVRTAKDAGFTCVGIKDKTSARDWEDIQKIADYSTEDYEGIINLFD